MDKSLVPVECKSTSIAVVHADFWGVANNFDNTPKHSNVAPTSSSTDQDWIKWPQHVSPEISVCKKKLTGDKLQSGTAATVDNASTTSCAFWVLDGDRYDCLRCPFGQIPQGTTIDNGFYKDCASTNNNFSSEEYQNIPPIWAYYFSVHACTGGVPVLALQLDHTGGDVQFDKFA